MHYHDEENIDQGQKEYRANCWIGVALSATLRNIDRRLSIILL